jgi:hypothetical protein
MTKTDSAGPSTRAQAEGLVAGQNMFRKLENLNFVIVSACDEPSTSSVESLSRVDFEFRASNFRF